MFHDILPCHGTTQQFIDPFTYVFKVSSQSAGIMLRMKNGSGQFRQLSADEWTLLRQAQDPAKAIQHVAMILRPNDAADRKSVSLSILEMNPPRDLELHRPRRFKLWAEVSSQGRSLARVT